VSDPGGGTPAATPTPQSVQRSAAPGSSLEPALIRQFFEVQTQEIAARRDEVSLRRQELSNTHDYAQQALKAESEDLQQGREAERSARRDQMLFAGFVLILITGFVIYALHAGKDQIATEAVKDIALFGVGGLGGYAIGWRKTASQEANDDD
jgi:hypothetical protein